jgi:hypothetical protein
MTTAAATIQQRIEARRAGRIAISVLLLATLAAIVVTNLPDSRLRTEAMRVAGPYLEGTGLSQDWAVFAPDPRRASIELQARVKYANGHMAIWTPPRGDDLAGASWDYRWLKWVENTIQDARRDMLWKPAAEFVARDMRRTGAPIASVTLIRRWRDVPPPGRSAPEPPWRSYAFYELPRPDGGAR